MFKKAKNPYISFVIILLASIIMLQITVLVGNAISPSSPVLGLRLDGKLVGTPMGQKKNGLRVQEALAKAADKSLIAKFGDQTKTISLKDLGISVNGAASKTQVLQDGRTGTWLERVIYQDMAFFGRRNDKSMVYITDQATSESLIKTLANQVNRNEVNASFSFVEGKAVITPEQDGYVLENTEALQAIQRYLDYHEKELLLTVTTKVPSIKASDIEPLLSQVNQITSTALTIDASEQKQTLTPEEIFSAITLLQNEQSHKVQITFDITKITKLISSLKAKIDVTAISEISDGTDILSTGKDGRTLNTTTATNTIIGSLEQREASSSKGSAEISLAVTPLKHGTVIQKPKIVHLTFDDAPGQATNQILDELKQAGIHATFFVVGSYAENLPDSARRIANEGHTIGNHTYEHVDLRQLNTDQVRSQIVRAQEAIAKATGVTPNLFRAPYSYYSDTVKSVVASLGMSIMSYTVDPGDWLLPGVQAITSKVVNRVAPDSIVILHVNQQTADALPAIIQGLKAKGYKFR